jgi:DNA ligase (NAD+)
MIKIIPPTNCPSCDSSLVWKKDQIFCINDTCPAKNNKQVEHFSTALKIKGLGPSTIQKLGLESILDIYDLSFEVVSFLLKSDVLAGKLVSEIEKSKTETLDKVLPALGVPLIGKVATDKLSKIVTSLVEINNNTCKKAGLGPKATENLINWLNNNKHIIDNLPFNFEFSSTTGVQDKETICITGKLKSYSSKAEATLILENLGYKVKDNLTADVTLLVNESGVETAKTKKAANSGVIIINNLKTYLEN